MRDLPPWVWDVVIALEKHREEHPRYYAQCGVSDYARADTCGCEPLALVPRDVKDAAEVLVEDRRRRELDKTDGENP